MLAVAVGSRTLKLVSENLEGDPTEVNYDVEGLEEIVVQSESNGREVLLAGNRRWCEALAYAITARGFPCFYLGRIESGDQKGLVGFVKTALKKGFRGRPFFGSTNDVSPKETDHPWINLANEYERTNKDVRRGKHRVLDALRVLFPELLKLEEKLWHPDRKKALMTAAIKNDWSYFETEYAMKFAESIAKDVPEKRDEEARSWLVDALKNLGEAEWRKEEVAGRIETEVGDHPVVKAYNDSFTAMMVVLMVGWRKWANWRHLRSYAGLAVTRIDGKGRPRIGRQRGIIRTNLYHLRLSSRGKEVVAAAMKRTDKRTSTGKLPLIKRLERILKDVYHILQPQTLGIK